MKVLIGTLLLYFVGSLCFIQESSDLLVRKRRVINYEHHGTSSRAVDMREYGYVVSIRENGKPHHCAGAILSFRIVITAAKCVVLPVTQYKITAGVIRHTNGQEYYNITSKSIHMDNNPSRPEDGIFLLTVAPTFEFGINIRSIGLHRKPVEPGTLVSVPGWGCNIIEHEDSRWEFNKPLGLITVRVISHQNCANAYHQMLYRITERHICTHDTSRRQYCGVTDQGAPLVVHTPAGRTELIGINLWGGSLVEKSRPDIYVNVIHPYYLNWIGLRV